MSGSPIKHERNRLVREAILRGLEEGVDPVEYMKPYAEKLKKMALKGRPNSSVTLGALKEIFDRVDGKPAQEIVGEGLIAPTLTILLADVGLEEKVVEGEVVPQLIGDGKSE